MRERVEAIYRNGVLSPLVPLSLPENTRVEVTVRLIPTAIDRQRQAVRHALIAAGLSLMMPESIELPAELLPERSEELAQMFSIGKPLSEVILEERVERF